MLEDTRQTCLLASFSSAHHRQLVWRGPREEQLDKYRAIGVDGPQEMEIK